MDCGCLACKAYRRDGSNYEMRVRREYVWALARERNARTWRARSDARKRAYAQALRVVQAQDASTQKYLKSLQERPELPSSSEEVL